MSFWKHPTSILATRCDVKVVQTNPKLSERSRWHQREGRSGLSRVVVRFQDQFLHHLDNVIRTHADGTLTNHQPLLLGLRTQSPNLLEQAQVREDLVHILTQVALGDNLGGRQCDDGVCSFYNIIIMFRCETAYMSLHNTVYG